ncbi:MAG: RIP metalloprotease RseP [Lachnospiraceae bacterium]|nr:RIP metalloprotease RseP [Lachnospiraceae bacterium]
MEIRMSIIYTLLILGVLVTVHEFGHFIVAKKCGIGVIEFSIGMGPRLFSFDKNGTKYSLKLIPFGGSCAMVGEDEDNDAENAFNNKSPWARLAVVFAGPFFNFLLAFVVAAIIIAFMGINPPKVNYVYEGYGAAEAGIQEGDLIKSINGKKMVLGKDISLYEVVNELPDEVEIVFERDGKRQTAVYNTEYERYQMGISYMNQGDAPALTEVYPGTPAESAGLKAGDIIVSINGTDVSSGTEVYNYFRDNEIGSAAVDFVVKRDGEQVAVTVTPALIKDKTLGFIASYAREKAGLFSTLRNALSEVRFSISNVIYSIKMLITGRANVSDVAGPVGMVSIVGDVVEQSSQDGAIYVIMNLLNLVVLLSANLGVMNLLPIPALDGGRIMLTLFEIIRRKPLDREKEGMVNGIGFIILFALMILVMFNDIFKLLR